MVEKFWHSSKICSATVPKMVRFGNALDIFVTKILTIFLLKTPKVLLYIKFSSWHGSGISSESDIHKVSGRTFARLNRLS